jgi:hypothetical protein
MPHVKEETPETVRHRDELIRAHDMVLEAMNAKWLDKEGRDAALVYHDCLCWVLGNEEGGLPLFLQALVVEHASYRAQVN